MLNGFETQMNYFKLHVTCVFKLLGKTLVHLWSGVRRISRIVFSAIRVARYGKGTERVENHMFLRRNAFVVFSVQIIEYRKSATVRRT